MTKEQIFTEIQNIVSANPVLVIGSGASVPYNIPGMNTLAAELKDFLGANPYKNPDSKKAVHEFIENLNHGMGLEKALLNTKATDEVENDIVCKVWNLIEYADRDVYIKILQVLILQRFVYEHKLPLSAQHLSDIFSRLHKHFYCRQ